MSAPSTPPLTPRKARSFHRSWVPYAQEGEVEVQRLSRLAIFERARGPNRFRIVQNGVIIALYRNKEELQAALATCHTLPKKGPLLEQVANQPEDSPRSKTSREGSPEPGRSPSPGPAAPFESGSSTPRSGSQTPRHGSPAPRPRTPLADKTRSESGEHESPVTPINDSTCKSELSSKMHSKLSKFLHSQPEDKQAEDKLDDDDQLKQFLTPPPPIRPGSPLAEAMVVKTQMSPEELRAHRLAGMKPPSPDQEPTSNFERVLTWRYDGEAEKWTFCLTQVSIAEAPFAEGAMHKVFKMTMLEKGQESHHVAKLFSEPVEQALIAPDSNEPDLDVVLQKSAMVHYASSLPHTAFETKLVENFMPGDGCMTKGDFIAWFRRMALFKQAVEMQGFCQAYAKAFNVHNPPKEVHFPSLSLVGLYNHPDKLMYLCEPFIEGVLDKPDTNGGALSYYKNTPQAFSHFSYVASDKKHVIVDIQSIGDMYTDPQVHSIARQFNSNNLKQDGIDKFFQSHRCNNICVHLGLANAKDVPSSS